MKRFDPHIRCKACGGAGMVPLPTPYARTLGLLSKEWLPTDALLARHCDGVQRTALINRLNLLVDVEFAERRGNNHGIEWRRAK